MKQGLSEIYEAILDQDGSCRDVTFANVPCDRLAPGIALLNRHFGSVTATDCATGSIVHLERELGRGQQEKSYILELSSGLSAISNAQFFIETEPSGMTFLELTFFPQDIRQIDRLFLLLNDLRSKFSSDQYWLRYENASWELGDVGTGSGVICTSSSIE